MLIINIMLNAAHQKGDALIYLLSRLSKIILMASVFEELNNRLHPEKLDSQVKKAIVESSKKNWVKRNPILFALIMSIVTALITKLLDKLIP